ncbi:UNVERIFIED_CONTAM: hypothetical protein HDU68_003173 [Siphonaria sp. JEL0065]|nr:hypothetical protein HDU68_003173 [Siphonaria sp. JEL0065]
MSETETGKRKAGRKPTDSEPATKRIARAREVAQAYKQRKAAYVQSLESTIHTLSSQGSSPENQSLKLKIQQLEAENAFLKQFAPQPMITQSNYLPVLSLEDESFSGFLDQFADAFPPTIHFDTFKSTHVELLQTFDPQFTLLSNVELARELEALVDSELAIAPTAFEVIAPFFVRIKREFEAIPALKQEPELLSGLLEYWTRFTEYKTRPMDGFTCRITLSKVKKLQHRILQKCDAHCVGEGGNQQSVTKVKTLFGLVKEEFNIDVDLEYEQSFVDWIKQDLKCIPSFKDCLGGVDELCSLYNDLGRMYLTDEERKGKVKDASRLQKRLLDFCPLKTQDRQLAEYNFECLSDVFGLSY